MATDDAALPGVPTRTRYRRWRNKLWIHRARVAWIIGGLAAAALLWALARMLTGSAPDGAAKRGRGRSGEHVIQPRVRDMVAKTPVEDRDIGKRPGAEACGPGGAVERYRGTSEDFWLCVHSDSDVISDSVREKGVWDDCEDQAWLLWTLFGGAKGAQGERGWVGSAAGSDAREGSAKEIGRSLNIVEVGANIGVCTARLARLGHRVWALEPIPDNFARLEGSLRLGGEGLDSRVARFNLGASDRTGERSAVIEEGNAGNSVLLRPGGSAEAAGATPHGALASRPGARFRSAGSAVGIAPLDALLRPSGGGAGGAGAVGPTGGVDVLLLDCQGCELEALRGAESLIQEGRVETVVLELSPAHLQAAGHRAETLLTWLHAHQFRISTLLFGTAVLPEDFRSFAARHAGADGPPVNLLARRDTDPVARRARDHANVHWDHKVRTVIILAGAAFGFTFLIVSFWRL